MRHFTCALVVAAAAATGLHGCVKPAQSADASKTTAENGNAEETAEAQLETINVKIREVKTGELTEFVTVRGKTAADAAITYSAEVAGRVEYLGVDLGNKVGSGQVLARVDFEMLKAQAEQAQTNFDLAEKTLKRVKALSSENLASQQTVDEAESRFHQSEAALRIANANLNHSVVRAKRGGVVVRKHVEPGEYVGPGMPIVEVVDYRVIEVVGQLPETQVANVSAGSEAKVRIEALGRTFDGSVHVVVPVATLPANTFEIRVRVDNKNLDILVGMAATVQVVAKVHQNAIVANHDVVIEEESGRSVFVESDGLARKRSVSLGPSSEGRVILLDGITVGERLVVLGQRDLIDGQPVRVLQ